MISVRCVLLAALAAAAFVSHALAAPATNVILIVADDMGYADTGVTGCKDFATPNIDSIARGGVMLSRAYVTAAICSPSRAGFLTGRYQQRFGHEHNSPPKGLGLPLSEKMLADHFKAAGFVTGLVGKWHLGEAEPYRPTRRGFDEFVGHLGGDNPYFPPVAGKPNRILEGDNPVEWNEYLTTYFGKRAVDFIGRHADKPFFLYLSYNAPHTPMQARAEDLEKVAHIKDERRRTYAAMMLALDESIGAVLSEVKARNLENNTMIVFMSDNGGPQPGDPSVNGSSNRPFRSGKAQYFEGGIRVPMFIKLPGTIAPGSTYDKSVVSLDLLPTFMSAVGHKPIEGVALDGVDLLPFLSGKNESDPHAQLYWRTGAAMGLIQGTDKLVWFRREGGLPENPERVDLTKTQVYDLGKDPGEKNDLSGIDPARRQQLIDAWLGWDKTMVTPLWGMWDKKSREEKQQQEKAAAPKG